MAGSKSKKSSKSNVNPEVKVNVVGAESRMTGVSIPNEKSHRTDKDHNASTRSKNARANEPKLKSDSELKKTVSASSGGSMLNAPSHFATTPDKLGTARGMNAKRNGAMLRTQEERHELGSALFQEQAEFLRSIGLASDESPQDEAHRCKVDVKFQLEITASLAEQGLKMCGSDGSIYLLERVMEDLDPLIDEQAHDALYQEEVRFKHCKLHTLLDETRDFPASSLQRDLVRNREIRNKCAELIRGGRPEPYTVDEEEVHELIRVRNSIRTWYGGQNTLKGQQFDPSSNDRTIMQMRPSEIAVRDNAGAVMSTEFVDSGEAAANAGSTFDE
jgi:hypothetical protein